MSGWGERYCNNVYYVKNKPPSMRTCSSTPPKQNQDNVKEHNRTHHFHNYHENNVPPCKNTRLHISAERYTGFIPNTGVYFSYDINL